MKKSVLFVLFCFLFFPGIVQSEENNDKKNALRSFWEEVLTLPVAPIKGSVDLVSDQIFNLGQIQVSGSRVSSGLSDVSATNLPRNISYVGSREINEHPDASLPEILASKEGVTLTDDLGGGAGARLDLRGFGGEAKQSLVLLDGLRAVEPFDNSMTWYLYPAEYLKQAEIRRGGGSTVYGEGALSGVVNLETKEPTKEFHVATDTSIGDFQTQKYFVETSGTVHGIGFYLGGRYYQTEGYRQNALNDNTSMLLKNTYSWTDLLSFENQFYYSDGKVGIAGPLSAVEVERDRRQKDPDAQFGDGFTDQLTQNGFKTSFYLEKIDVMLTNLLGWRFRRQDSVQTFGGAFPGQSTNHIKTVTYSDVIQATWQRENDVYKNKADVGVEWSLDDISNPSSFLDFSFGPFSAEKAIDRRMVGYFLQDHLELMDKWVLEAGVRYDNIDWDIYDLLSPNLQKRKDTDNWSPSVGLEYKLWEPLSIYGSYSESFKVPDSNTLIFETPNIFSPNPNLEPSLAEHYELGVRYAHPIFGSIRAAYFYINTEKEILFNDITNTNENFDTRRQGLELGSEVRVLKNTDVILNYTYTSSEFDGGAYDGKDIPLVPRHKWSAGFRVRSLEGLNIYVTAGGAADQFALNDFNNLFSAEDYWTLDSRISYHRDNWELYARLDNILDEEYSTFVTSDGVSLVNYNPMPTRTLEVGFKLEI